MSGYRLFVSDSSYYSGKLEGYLRYKGIPHERIEINIAVMREQILPATGFMKVPVMQCPDGRWLKDTTPMIQWLDHQHPEHPVYPDDPAARFIALLVEDYADEWITLVRLSTLLGSRPRRKSSPPAASRTSSGR